MTQQLVKPDLGHPLVQAEDTEHIPERPHAVDSSRRPCPADSPAPARINPATASHALVESPLQLLSALEARLPDEQLVIHARSDATGMPVFLEQFPAALQPAGVVITADRQPTDSLPHTDGRVLVGDVLSGQFQRQLVGAVRTGQLGLGKRPRRGPAELILLDDGLATVAAIRTLSRNHTHPLIRSSLDAGKARIALGQATAFIVRRLMRADRLTWVTAMKVDKHLARKFTTAGGRLHRHRFEWARGLDWAQEPVENPTTAHSQVVLGTAFAADGLISTDDYVAWVADLTAGHDGPSVYYPHRRQTAEVIERLRTIPHLTVAQAGLPIELRLAQAPKRTVVRSLPSTAVTTLPLVMRHPLVTVDAIPEAWWTGVQPDSKRRALNELTDHALPAKKPRRAAVRILAVADSESYLKWAIQLLERLQEAHPHVDADVVLMDSPIKPTGPQIAAAVAGTRWQDLSVRVIKRAQLRRYLRWSGPTIVLAAATGPVVSQVYATSVSVKHRPGLVSGLPGIGLPATPKGQRYRKLGDVFITHSQAESTAYTDAIQRARGRARTVVTTLPMLTGPQPDCTQDVDTVVFAPQAKVPRDRADRIAILLALAAWRRRGASEAGEAAPGFAPASRRVILKVRSRHGEHETHLENHSFLALRDELIASGRLLPKDIEVQSGPMSDFLAPGSALVTVSSTAALEALDRGLPALILTDFGLNDRLLNSVFIGSGLEGTLDDVAHGRFRHGRPEWLHHNYFQAPTDDLYEELEELSQAANAEDLERDVLAPVRFGGRRIRAELRSAAPGWIVSAYRRARRR